MEIEKAYESTGPPIKVEATGREPVEGGTARRSSLSLIGNSKVQPAVSSTAHRRYSVAAPNEAGLSKIMKLPPDLIPNRMTENVSHSSRNSRRCAVVESSNDNDKRTSTHLAESFLNMGPSCPPEPVNSRITEYETGVTTTRSDRHHHFQSRPVIAPLFTPPLLPPPPPPIPAVAITTVATVVSTAAIVTITATIPTTTTVVVNAGPVVACQVGIPSCPRISPPRENNHVETRWNTESAASTKPVGNSSEDGVKSKLDLVIERARLKKRGIDDDGLEDMDDEDAAEENRISRLITIFSGPPLPLDTSKEVS